MACFSWKTPRNLSPFHCFTIFPYKSHSICKHPAAKQFLLMFSSILFFSGRVAWYFLAPNKEVSETDKEEG